MAKVWQEDNWVYKRQHEFFTDNEIYFYKMLFPTGYVPYAEQVDRDLIRTEFIPLEEVTSITTFLMHLEPALHALRAKSIRHGDLTGYAIRVKDNKPYLIDFSESRFIDDPRPDKRPEGDRYWLTKTMHELANVTNLRFAKQWRIISKHVNFAGKSVLDLGCGHGDMLRAAYEAQASEITGVDYDQDVLDTVKANVLKTAKARENISLVHADINEKLLTDKVDIIICFSVLPYLKSQDKTLDWISYNSALALLEVQYENDGPGKIKDDLEAKDVFSNYFEKVTPLGKTLVDYRSCYRTIWLCKGQKYDKL